MIDQSQTTPFLSVIIPVYNRAELVVRAIRSVLVDPAGDVEVIVVDDASTDSTVNRVAEISDARLRLVSLPTNAGCCAARNAGARAARGEWLVFLDSDDELAPHSLDMIRQRAMSAPADVGKLLFACLNDSGTVSPEPPFDGQFMDYVGYLRWIESTIDGLSEALPTTRRDAFLRCPYPEQRDWLESIHELDFVRDNRVQRCPEVVRLYHVDAPIRLMVPDVDAVTRGASGRAAHAEAVLAGHGTAMQMHAPRRWVMLMRETALYNFFAGDRRKGLGKSVKVLSVAPTNLRTWAVLIAGAISPALLRRLWATRRAQLAA